MRKLSRYIFIPVALLAVAGSLALAADQTILGRVLTVKNPGDPIKRKIVGVGKEKASPNTIVGNPTLAGPTGGGVLRVIANGGTPSDQSFALPQGTSSTGKPFWVATGSTGFKYRDSKGDQGPVKSVTIKRSGSGSFLIKASLSGRNGTINVTPPNPGTSGFVTLQIGQVVGERYCVQYGPESQIKNSGTKLFRAKKPLNQGCPGAPSTTTTTTPTTTTTTTTIYGSPSRAFLTQAADLLD
jgi:hypothetical protein